MTASAGSRSYRTGSLAATDTDEATAALSTSCSVTAAAAAADHHDNKSSEEKSKSRDSALAFCYVNPIYSPARHVRRVTWT